MNKTYRTGGAVGALLDEYEKAILELADVIADVSDQDLVTITDHTTTDPSCVSIQAVLSHVVHAAYGYATYIRNRHGDKLIRPDKTIHTNAGDYISDLKKVVVFTEQVLQQVSPDEVEEMDNSKKMFTGWGQIYDIEQLMEHAIVHVLRHRRQIERFKIMLAAAS